jgi:hypothetical protein
MWVSTESTWMEKCLHLAFVLCCLGLDPECESTILYWRH